MLNTPGRFSIGTELEMMMRAPLMMPAAPIPAIARPTMSMAEETAAPHRTEPISKMRKNRRKEY
jgi:hypothetical protein